MSPAGDALATVRSRPSVHYGGTVIPATNQICLGGQVKFQRLQPYFPDGGAEADILYMVSSSLPEKWLPTYWNAKSKGRRVVWNHSAVSYKAVWPEIAWDDDNLLLEQGLHAADYAVYQSRFSRQAADKFLGPFSGPSEVLYNAVNTDVFVPKRTGQCGAEITLLLAGTQYRWTSVEIALSALEAFRRGGNPARLIITGAMCWKPDRVSALLDARRRVEQLGLSASVEFPGEYSQADAPDIFNRADILLHTRYDDLCPNVVIEAMACGVPVVYSNSGGTPELVGETAGVGVETGHSWDTECLARPAVWAGAIEEVANGLPRFAGAARQQAIDRFSIGPWIARHAEIFEYVHAHPPRNDRGRRPVNERLRTPLTLVAVQPDGIRQGQQFNTQPDGRSAVGISAMNASHATLVLLDGEVQETAYSSPSWLTAALARDFGGRAGNHRFQLTELLRDSEELDFVVAPEA